MDAAALRPVQSGSGRPARKEGIASRSNQTKFPLSAPAFWFVPVLAAASALAGAEIRPGASLEEVHATLGQPRGQLHVGGRQVLYYERGGVELQHGTVTQVNLRSPEEHALRADREARQRGEREARRAQLMAAGIALRERKLADATLLAAPAAYQVAFWEDFARQYPEVSCAEPLAIARLRLNEQREEKLRRETEASRLAGIEERLAAADRRQEYYAVRTYAPTYGRRHYRPAGLGPITYTFFDSPLPPYTTPSGNPAGNFTSPVQPGQDGQGWPRWEPVDQGRRDDRPDRSPGRGFGAGRFRERT